MRPGGAAIGSNFDKITSGGANATDALAGDLDAIPDAQLTRAHSGSVGGEALNMTTRTRDVLAAVALTSIALALAYLLVPLGLHLLMR